MTSNLSFCLYLCIAPSGNQRKKKMPPVVEQSGQSGNWLAILKTLVRPVWVPLHFT